MSASGKVDAIIKVDVRRRWGPLPIYFGHLFYSYCHLRRRHG